MHASLRSVPSGSTAALERFFQSQQSCYPIWAENTDLNSYFESCRLLGSELPCQASWHDTGSQPAVCINLPRQLAYAPFSTHTYWSLDQAWLGLSGTTGFLTDRSCGAQPYLKGTNNMLLLTMLYSIKLLWKTQSDSPNCSFCMVAR